MQKIIISFWVLFLPSVTLAIPCKLYRTDNMVIYGHCAKYKSIVVFKSGAGFTCQVSSRVTRPLEGDEKLSVVKDRDIVKETVEEHGSDPKKIPYCMYTR